MDFEQELPPGTRLATGPGIAVVTDEPEYSSSSIFIGSPTAPDIFAPLRCTNGVGYGDDRDDAIRAAIADYLAKKTTDV